MQRKGSHSRVMWGQQLLLLRADVINLHANTHNFMVSFSDMPIISKRETFTTSSYCLFRIINRNCPERSKRKFSPLASKLVLEQCKNTCYFDEETFVWWFCVSTLSRLVDYKISAKPTIERRPTWRVRSAGLTSDNSWVSYCKITCCTGTVAEWMETRSHERRQILIKD